jgi:hypothetical protein
MFTCQASKGEFPFIFTLKSPASLNPMPSLFLGVGERGVVLVCVVQMAYVMMTSLRQSQPKPKAPRKTPAATKAKDDQVCVTIWTAYLVWRDHWFRVCEWWQRHGLIPLVYHSCGSICTTLSNILKSAYLITSRNVPLFNVTLAVCIASYNR